MAVEEKLAKIVGAGNASDKQAVLEEYASDMSFVNPIRPAYVVKPKTAEDVEKIIKLPMRRRHLLCR